MVEKAVKSHVSGLSKEGITGFITVCPRGHSVVIQITSSSGNLSIKFIERSNEPCSSSSKPYSSSKYKSHSSSDYNFEPIKESSISDYNFKENSISGDSSPSIV